jgi:hypothetical protein
MHADEPSQNQGFKVLQAFRAALGSQRPPDDALLSELCQQGLLEQALLELKRHRPGVQEGDPWRDLRLRMEQEVSRSRERRMQRWQLDPGRRTIRLRLEVCNPACLLHPPALQAALAKALMEAGVPVAMGLEKAPRPLVRLGHPLPQGIEGLSEWADATLRRPLAGTEEELIEQIHGHCPEGLKILALEEISNHATPVLELCQEAHWRWLCPSELRLAAVDRFARFEASASYAIAKVGKVEGQKQVKQVEVRHLVLQMGWEESTFLFTTRLSAAEALNPVKLLAGVLGLDAGALGGLTRLSVTLAEDPRLAQAEKYETKLHNIFEDAVLLDSDATLQLVEEDDDEPLLLRKDPGQS